MSLISVFFNWQKESHKICRVHVESGFGIRTLRGGRFCDGSINMFVMRVNSSGGWEWVGLSKGTYRSGIGWSVGGVGMIELGEECNADQ